MPPGGTISWQTKAVSIAMHAAFLGHKHADSIHYTDQGSPTITRRWDGIALTKHALSGQYPNYADCSSFVTWCYWNALHLGFGVSDQVNGTGWASGFTGTMTSHGKRVSKPAKGDAIFYGDPIEHVAIYVGGGMVITHGSESGPFFTHLKYRGDVADYRRYIY